MHMVEKIYTFKKGNQMSRTMDLAGKLIFETLKILKENDGEMASSLLMEALSKRVSLDEWAKGTLEKTGNIRWQSILHFYSIDLIKAGYLLKKKGVWYLTPEGEKAMAKGEKELLRSAQNLYRVWKEKNKKEENIQNGNKDVQDEQIEEVSQRVSSLLEDARAKANQSFTKFILEEFDPYSFQELCGALFRGMGYYTPFIAPKGKDGGVDVIAYKDPIGSTTPHIKIQIKYRQDTKATSQELRQLKGILTTNDIGVFISISGFASDALKEFKHSSPHIELIDLERFIELWQEFYDKMKDEDKALMPISPVYFVDKD